MCGFGNNETDTALLEELAKCEGYDEVFDMLDQASYDSVAPGICVTPDCGYTCEVEPDSRDGWCEECMKGSVKSCLVLAGII